MAGYNWGVSSVYDGVISHLPSPEMFAPKNMDGWKMRFVLMRFASWQVRAVCFSRVYRTLEVENMDTQQMLPRSTLKVELRPPTVLNAIPPKGLNKALLWDERHLGRTRDIPGAWGGIP